VALPLAAGATTPARVATDIMLPCGIALREWASLIAAAEPIAGRAKPNAAAEGLPHKSFPHTSSVVAHQHYKGDAKLPVPRAGRHAARSFRITMKLSYRASAGVLSGRYPYLGDRLERVERPGGWEPGDTYCSGLQSLRKEPAKSGRAGQDWSSRAAPVPSARGGRQRPISSRPWIWPTSDLRLKLFLGETSRLPDGPLRDTREI